MTPLTRAQREALAAVYHRAPCWLADERFPAVTTNPAYAKAPADPDLYVGEPISYLQFRRTVHYGSYDPCIMLRWAGMWLGIEADGYTHS